MRWLATCLALLPLPALAAVPDYDLVELVYFHVHADSVGTRTGYQANGSLDLGQGFFGEATDYHVTGSGTTVNSYLAGAGYRRSYELTDVFLSVDYLHVAKDTPLGSVSQDGYRWVWGLRAAVNDRLELNTGVEKASVGNTATGIRAGVSYKFLGDHLALRAQYVWASAVKTWIVGLRYLY
jgi:hypothetical protein